MEYIYQSKVRLWISGVVFLWMVSFDGVAQDFRSEYWPRSSAASLALVKGDYLRAEQLYTELITQFQSRVMNPYDEGLICMDYQKRSGIRATLGDFRGAEADFLMSLKIAKKMKALPGSNRNLMMVFGYQGLMDLYYRSGNLKRALQAFEAARFFRDALKKEHSQILAMMGGRDTTGYTVTTFGMTGLEGVFLRRLGKYEEALESFRGQENEVDKSWANYLKFQGSQIKSGSKSAVKVQYSYYRAKAWLSVEKAETQKLLGMKDASAVSIEKALDAASKGIEILEVMKRIFAEEPSPEVIDGRMAPLSGMGELVAARRLIQQGERQAVSSILSRLRRLKYERTAELLFREGRYRDAVKLIEEGILNDEKVNTVGQTRSPVFSSSFSSPLRTYRLLGDARAAVDQYEQALSAYEKSKAIAQKLYSESHPESVKSIERISLLRAMGGNLQGANVDALFKSRMKSLANLMTYSGESEQISFRSTLDPWSFPATLGMTAELTSIVLSTKGIVLESILKERARIRRAGSAGGGAIVSELAKLQRQLLENSLVGVRDRNKELEIKTKILNIKTRLGRGSEIQQDFLVRVDEVVDALPDGGALLEYIKYRHFTSPGIWIDHYGVIVISSLADPVFIKLDTVEKVDRLISELGSALKEAGSDEQVENCLRELSESVFDPVIPLVKDCTRLIVSPDASLNFVSFSALLEPDGQFIADKWKVSYVASGRDLLGETEVSNEELAWIVANPDFDSKSNGARQNVENHSSDVFSMRGPFADFSFPGLPGTSEESDQLTGFFTGDWNWKVENRIGAEATEDVIMQIESPRILHLATHGFFLPKATYASEAYSGSESKGVNLDNPMHRSGIALAGANPTLRKWSKGVVGNTENDGIVSAQEMAELDLEGTWLVVLSACDTAVGQSVSGEGVLGIRRGLMQAGAKNLLLTLWPIADKETVQIMIDFYHNLQPGVQPEEALFTTQKKFLNKFREEKGIATAVRLAGPFVLSFRN